MPLEDRQPCKLARQTLIKMFGTRGREHIFKRAVQEPKQRYFQGNPTSGHEVPHNKHNNSRQPATRTEQNNYLAFRTLTTNTAS